MAQSPWVPDRAAFLLAVRIAGAPPRGNVRVSVHEPVPNRAALGQAVASDEAGHELFNLDPLPLDDQPSDADGTRQVSIIVKTHESGSTSDAAPGVYPVQVQLRQRDGTVLARLTTSMVRVPPNSSPADRLRAVLMVKLHTSPVVDESGRVRPDRTSLQKIKALVNAFRAHPKVAAALVPTPQSLESLRESDNASDATLLEQVRSISRAGRQVLTPTYVRVDPSAWVGAGLTEELGRQRLVGTKILTGILPKAAGSTWAADTGLTPAAIGRLRDTGVQQLVVPERTLAPLDPTKFPDSPTEPFKVETDTGIPIPAVQIDARLQDAFQRVDDPVLGANQLLAELALTSLGLAGTPGGVVVAPPDDWRPSPVFLRVLLDALGPDNPLVVATTVDHFFAQVPPAGSNGAATSRSGGDRGVDLVRTLTTTTSRSLGAFPDHLRNARSHLASYASMVGPASPRLASFERRIQLADSADLAAGRQDHLFELVNDSLTRQFARVTAPAREKVTLTSRNADFPLTLQSRLGYPVDVVIDLEASNRLTFPEGNRIAVRLDGPRTKVKLAVRAPVSGDTPLQVTVRSADGNLVLAQSRYTVRSTAVSGVGIILTIGASLFLVIWWIRHWRSSARRRSNGSLVR